MTSRRSTGELVALFMRRHCRVVAKVSDKPANEYPEIICVSMARTFERWDGSEFSSTFFRYTDAQPPPSRRRILSPIGRWLTGGRCSFSPERQTRFRVFKKMSSDQFGSGTKRETLHY